MMLVRSPPPMWLCLGLPVLMLLWTVTIYQEQMIATSTDVANGVAHKISASFQGQEIKPAHQLPATIIREGDHDEYFAICLYVRDQAQDLVEFFQHHYHQMGVRRFYVMDDGSDPPMSHYMHKFGIPEEAVDFIHFDISTSVPQGSQHRIDNLCNYVYGVNNTWIAYIDADEFFDTPSGETIEDVLRSFEISRPDVGAVGVNWEVHSSGHHITHVESVRKEYLECITDDMNHNGEGSESKHIKSIVRTDAYLNPQNPHKFNLNPGFVTVGEHGDLVKHFAFRQPITRDRISLHHYVTKSFEDYADKVTRSSRDWSYWNHVNYDMPHQACVEMLKYFPPKVNKDGFW